MATFRFTWFGVQLQFSENETNELIAVAAEATALNAFVAAIFPVTAPVTVIVGGILAIGAGALKICDSANHRGTLITVLWVGLPWCTGL
jgi:hypothetical protein